LRDIFGAVLTFATFGANDWDNEGVDKAGRSGIVNANAVRLARRIFHCARSDDSLENMDGSSFTRRTNNSYLMVMLPSLK